MTTPNISMAYVQGVQAILANKGHLNYASEKHAMYDASELGGAIDGCLSIDRGGLATEGAAPGETDIIAHSLNKLASTQNPAVRQGILSEAVNGLAHMEPVKFSKFAQEAPEPGDNNTVAGHKPGSVAAGESNVKKEDLNKELSNATPNTVDRKDYFSSMPGNQSDGGKGTIGNEGSHPDAEGKSSPVKDQTELSNAIPNTRERSNYHGGPGGQKDEDQGHIGTEKSAQLSNYLAKL